MHWHYLHEIAEFDEIAQADELSFLLDYLATFSNFQYIKMLRCIATKQDHVNSS